MSKVFISCPPQDYALVDHLEPVLRENGLLAPDDVIINRQQEMAPGTDVRQAIRAQMRDAAKVVILDTPASAQSSFVNYEAGMASALDKPIVVVHAKDGERSDFATRLGNVPSIELGLPLDECAPPEPICSPRVNEDLHERIDALHREIHQQFHIKRPWSFMKWPWHFGMVQIAQVTIGPRLEVTETATEILVAAELPGLQAEDVEIVLTGQQLSIRGEKKGLEDGLLYPRRTYAGIGFARQVPLPVPVIADSVSARFSDGVLTIVLPKGGEADAQNIVRQSGADFASASIPIGSSRLLKY